MDIRNLIPGRKTRAELQALRGEFGDLRRKAELQAAAIDDITTATTLQGTYSGNTYRTYDAVVKALAEKYDGKAEWGVLQTGNIIDVRAAFIIGQGIQVLAKDQADKEFKESPELEFINAFLEYNNLDREMAQEHAKEAEIEGCALFKLVWDKDDENVRIEHVSRAETKYQVQNVPGDYADYIDVRWTPAGSTKPVVLEAPDFVYGRFGGRIRMINEPYPKVGKALTEIEGLSKAIRDWREINHLFAAPVPTIECKDAADAKAMDAAATTLNWKAKKLLSIAGKLVYAQPNLGDGAAALEKEIVTLAKMISGTTGVPVHFLGLPDLMSNRATADNLMELVAASTRKERMIWIGIYQELITKAIELRNKMIALTPLAADTFKVEILYITAEAWQRIIDVWLPLYQSDAISLETILAQVPGVNVEDELERQATRADEQFQRFLNQQNDKGDEAKDEEEK